MTIHTLHRELLIQRSLAEVFDFLENLLRMLDGHMKPVHFSHTPPAAFANYIILRLAILMLALSLYGH